MQNLALLLLLAVTASMIFTFDPSVLAQETSETPSDEGMTEEETSEEATAEDETTQDETTEDEVTEEELGDEVTGEMEDATEEVEEIVDSPLMQMISKVQPHEIQCKSGQTLVFKASNWRPACVNESSFDALVARGWVASHDPTHEDLTKMQDDYMAAHPQEEVEVSDEQASEEETTETTDEEGVAMEDEIITEEETTEESTETEGETQPQNYTINLSESISVSTI